MERFDSVILITPNIGIFKNNNVFLKPLDGQELEFLEKDIIYDYKKINHSYEECMKDLKDKMQKIKKILEE